jgi:uncharacterized C2H2 Zn-finger protein
MEQGKTVDPVIIRIPIVIELDLEIRTPIAEEGDQISEETKQQLVEDIGSKEQKSQFIGSEPHIFRCERCDKPFKKEGWYRSHVKKCKVTASPLKLWIRNRNRLQAGNEKKKLD